MLTVKKKSQTMSVMELEYSIATKPLSTIKYAPRMVSSLHYIASQVQAQKFEIFFWVRFLQDVK